MSQQSAPAQRGGGSRPKNRKAFSHRKPHHKARVAVVEDEEENPEPFCFCTGQERGVKAEEWVVDSGATTHMTWDKGVFVTFAALQDMPSVSLGDGRTVKAEGKGSVRLRVSNNNDAECVIRLSSVLLVPDLSCNLFSVRDITDKGNKMLFDDVTCGIITKDNSVIASGHKRGNLYVLVGAAERRPDEAMVAAQPSSDLWHQRLAHVNDAVLQKIVSSDVAGFTLQKVEPRSFCEGCVQGKATRHNPKSLGGIHSSRKLEKVHSDMCGPMQTLSNSGMRYMVTFVDDFTCSYAVYFMAHKSDTLEMFKEFHAKVTGESGERIGILKTDGGGEYKSREFAQYLIRHQIEHEVTVPDAPEVNGLAEQMNRTILEKAKCMCVHAGLPYSLWAEAANTATYIYNRVPNAPLKGKSPHEMWYGRKPDLSNLKVFGCVAYALVPAAKRRKFGDRTEKMRFLGYHKGHRGYRLMERGGNRVFYRTDVTFDEHNFRLTPEEDERRVMETLTLEIDVCSSGRRAGKPAPEVPVAVPDRVPANLRVMPEMVAVRNVPQAELAAVHSRPTRMKKPIDRYGVDEQAKVAEVDDEVEEVIASALCSAEMDEPKTLREARKRPDASKWLAAAQEEMDSLMEHETWSLTKLPPGRKIVGSKWVFKVKLDENGEAARYKCRLVAQGYTQAQGVDYHETFAPVARFGSIRILLATAAQRGMHVHQMDVHTAFLNGKLEEDIYMSQPDGFVVEGKEEQVCHLHRSLYGLKQSPRCWNRELNCHLLDSGFQQSKADPCVYFRWKNGNLNIVSIYVDDLILVVDLMKDLEQDKRRAVGQIQDDQAFMGNAMNCSRPPGRGHAGAFPWTSFPYE